MNTLQDKYNAVYDMQKDLNRKLNQLEAESTLLLLMIKRFNEQGGLQHAKS